MVDFAYSHLHLRFNPFGELNRQQRIENAIPRCDLDAVCQFLRPGAADQRRAVQFTGRPGSGKSTHLLMLAWRQNCYRYTHIPVNTTRQVPVSDNLMVDEAQRLTWRQRNRLFPGAMRIVLGTHRCFRRKLQRCQFQVTTIRLDETPDVAWLQRAFDQRIQAARRVSSGNPPTVSRETIVNLVAEFGNNIRGMERRLYEMFCSLNTESRTVSSI